jgi:hypothetical protein
MRIRVGDCFNAFVLVNTAAFLGCVIAHAFGHVDAFSASFQQEGFCVGFKETPLFQSHILCFYVDTACALVLWGLTLRFKEERGMAPVASAASGIFVHGLAHLGIWFDIFNGEDDPRPGLQTPKPLLVHVKACAWLFAFFFALLRSAPDVPQLHAAAHAAIHAPVLTLLVPPRFSFTYVQTVLLWVACAYALLFARNKDVYYDLSALVVNTPVGLVAWVEALGCDSFFKSMGGHVWYDAIIPISTFAYCAIVLNRKQGGGKGGGTPSASSKSAKVE